MILSMTGYGKAVKEFDGKRVTVEIKAVNSKQLDLNMRMPQQYREKEMEIRNMLSQQAVRGKVDFSMQVEMLEQAELSQINKSLLAKYYKEIKEMSAALSIPEPTEWFSLLVRMPDVMKPEQQELKEEEWHELASCIKEAIASFADFRTQEGASLKVMFEEKIQNISRLLSEVEPYETERVEKVRERITEALSKIEGFDYDRNRLEQEMIFYIEKLDINEEKQRLTNHLSYFNQTIDEQAGQGKKLGFILQEIGREINTLGSKSNHHEMQKIVVGMKDELEQMKEQVLNIM